MLHSGFIFASYTYMLFTASYNYKAINAADKKLFKLMAKWYRRPRVPLILNFLHEAGRTQ